eukprot:1706079-Rhodomonas_salina.2
MVECLGMSRAIHSTKNGHQQSMGTWFSKKCMQHKSLSHSQILAPAHRIMGVQWLYLLVEHCGTLLKQLREH